MTRAPTDAEKRALDAALVSLEDLHGLYDANTGAILIADPGHAQTINVLAIVRAVIRSLREPTDSMMQAVLESAGCPTDGSWHSDDWRAGIDAASPEIKP